MLHYRTHVPATAAPGAPLLVLLHGRGSDESDPMGLVPHLPDGVAVVAPRAPHPAAPWGYGPGWAWYRFLGEDRPEPESFEAAQAALGELLDALPELLPVASGPRIVGGFSQGGTMALAHALRRPGAVEGVLNLSGFLASHPSVRAEPGTVARTRFFWGHGTRDGNIPHALAERGRSALRAAGADLEAHDYPIGHWIAPEEMADVSAWIGALAAPGAR